MNRTVAVPVTVIVIPVTLIVTSCGGKSTAAYPGAICNGDKVRDRVRVRVRVRVMVMVREMVRARVRARANHDLPLRSLLSFSYSPIYACKLF